MVNKIQDLIKLGTQNIFNLSRSLIKVEIKLQSASNQNNN